MKMRNMHKANEYNTCTIYLFYKMSTQIQIKPASFKTVQNLRI